MEGDGGLQLNIQELATLATQRLPVFCFVINNQGYASIRTSQTSHFNRLVGADASSGLHLPDLELLCKAYGVGYDRIDSHLGLSERIDALLSMQGPVICEIFVPLDEPRVPRVMTKIGEDGKPVSSSLEDLYPFLPVEEIEEQLSMAKKV